MHLVEVVEAAFVRHRQLVQRLSGGEALRLGMMLGVGKRRHVDAAVEVGEDRHVGAGEAERIRPIRRRLGADQVHHRPQLAALRPVQRAMDRGVDAAQRLFR